MNITCYPGTLAGTVRAIPSKSDAHRKLICAACSENGGFLPLRAPFCDDIAATIRCLRSLGADFREADDGLFVTPVRRQAHALLDCGESGSTLRFLLPVAMCLCGSISVTGAGRLPERPIRTLTDAMSAHGVQFSQASLPLDAAGSLRGGVYEIPGNISSQFLSGLLMALPLCAEDSIIRLTTPLQSAAYVDMTLQTLRLFGAEIAVSETGGIPEYRIKGKQMLHFPEHIEIDGDWSNAAFWLTAGALQADSPLTVSGLSPDSTQGDKAICGILQQAGAEISERCGAVTVSCNRALNFDVSMEEIPDLLPILAVRAALSAEGASHFLHAERLRLKESDRLTATANLLRAIGGRVDELPDGLTVYGGQLLGGTVDAQNDHRLVMAAAIAALRCGQPVTILGAEAVNKSYPGFFDDYRALGGNAVPSDT
ncbi:MAG: 3-phosphoshikimate 1-carboxyvinyltransferase [Oscillospiraceae bacterium]|nr:3-phosphoshikimate 1-carboxyvinyltransferase [Oscillospiraceae bacterium]